MRRRAGFLGLMVGLMGAVAAGAADAKTFVYCSEGSPENFNPQLNSTGTSFDAARPVMNRLVQFERGTTSVIPKLAESWTVSPDGLVYTFKLRPGVKWHSSAKFKPTRDFNADDVLFSFNRMWKADHPFHKVSGGAYDYFGDMGLPDLLKSIEKIDDLTVRFTLTRPEAPFIANIAMDFAVIQSAEYAAQLLKAGTPELIDQEPIGTGPYRFVQYQKDAIIRFKAFPDYFGGKQAIENLVFSITPDPAVRLQKLKAGECHHMPFPRPADLDAISTDKNLTLLSQPGLNVGYLAFNVQKKPLDDRRVRLALNHGIDKAAILKAVYGATGAPAKNPIPPIIWSYDPSTPEIPYDLAKAKALLAEAGVKEGTELDIWAMPVQRPYNPNAQRIAELIQADMAKLGLKAKIVTYEWGEYRKRMQDGEHMTGQMGWTGDNGDPDNFFTTLLGCDAARKGGGNLSKWCDKEFDSLLMQARATSDVAARTKFYIAAQKIFARELPWFPIAHSIVSEPVRSNVVGYKISPLGDHDFEGVDLK